MKAKQTPKTKNPDRGVVILALGHAYWGRWAYNLAMSLKYTCPEVKISLLYAGSGITQIVDKSLFDKVKEVPAKYYSTDGRIQYLKAKTALYKLSPYGETIYLDADMVWLPKRSVMTLFNELNTDFTMANRSWMALESDNLTDAFGIWASPKHIKEVFKFKEGRFYNLSSEMIYFKRTKEVSKLFADAFKLFDDDSFNISRFFNGGMPDELPFTISMIKNKIYPHKDNYKPFYWESAEHLRLQGADLNNGFYAYSMGGHISHPMMKKTYNNLVQFYCNQFNQRFPFFWLDKRGWMPGRQNL
ncbi:hypothetical protein LCGC14_0463930 [marine sediment metagenome]|uniref:Nucleotide-diphospho-sugar transferase domain-containing protein n=1 Tax=marine sediment metagenome TaxID=412755 RepID=A0A0F9SEB7_9ZZZZ